MKTLYFLRLAAALAAVPALAGPVAAQPPEAGLLNALSLISGGLLVPQDHPPQVTHDGNQYHVRVPLPVLAAPPNAAIDILASPLPNGAWDITSLTLPPTGSFAIQGQDPAPAAAMTFAVGQQAFHGTIDPSLTVPSPFKAELGRITLRTEAPEQRMDQTIERYAAEGTFSGDAEKHLNVRTLASLANWLITGSGDKPGATFKASVRSVSVRYDVDGLDRARAERLRIAAQTLSADRRDAMAAAPAGALPELTPAAMTQITAIFDALAGLMTRVNLDETIQGVHFEDNSADTVDIGKIQLGLAGDARDGRLTAYFDIGVSDPVASVVPMEYASYMPRRLVVRPALAGVRTDALLQLLRDAASDDDNLMALQSRAVALLNEPGARAGIETLLIESGPLHVEGSARIRPQPNGSLGFDVHLAARGLDAMINTLQRDPQAMQVLPMVFMVKGMAKPQGENLVWDIAYNGGPVMVNGMPFGQPQPAPPSRRSPNRR